MPRRVRRKPGTESAEQHLERFDPDYLTPRERRLLHMKGDPPKDAYRRRT